jgi:hypothetical protein
MSAAGRIQVEWGLVENQSDLDALDRAVYWSDAEAVALVADTVSANPLFPADVSRSGHIKWNVRLLLYVANSRGSHLELVLIDCDEIRLEAFNGLSLQGRVDVLKRIEIKRADGTRRLRCSRLMYRFIDVDQIVAQRFYGFEAAAHSEDAG